MHSTMKCYTPYISPFDPCPPVWKKCYSTPPNLYITFQPMHSNQFATAEEALYHGTLWPCLYDPYYPKRAGDEN
nr:spore coat associated protein CotJA [Gracilibacillus ureilyticus]